jgi:hypothetical protein
MASDFPPISMTDQEIETPSDTEEATEVDETTDADEKEQSRIGFLTRKIEKLEKTIGKLQPKDEETPVDDDETDFKIFHSQEIKLCKDEFKSYRAKGYDLSDALRLAKMDKGITEKSSEAERQVSESSEAATVQRVTKPVETAPQGLAEMVGDEKKALELKKKYGHLVNKVG